ncbi:hypothetical protein [Actinomadura bangladeshensis]|uniref:Uncharacterized protein n=1 Tax=Actinomadura bangladeshensis TaxID=453573 RepID=A0A6L9QAS8_9ACTN|nr:hypothetical protein [Actinomadura bangladeshensis]NEA22599.1 hypothetical protein [Actinomadura bangladeshensis]
MAQTTIPDPQAGPTEADEEAVLTEMYGPPDADGIYRGAPVREAVPGEPLPEIESYGPGAVPLTGEEH